VTLALAELQYTLCAYLAMVRTGSQGSLQCPAMSGTYYISDSGHTVETQSPSPPGSVSPAQCSPLTPEASLSNPTVLLSSPEMLCSSAQCWGSPFQVPEAHNM
jgi:hypothetical protein